MNCEKVKKVIIDQMYEESMNVDISEHLNLCSNCREYKESLEAAVGFMDKLDIQIPVETVEISKAIDGAFERAFMRKKRLEVVYFIGTAILILTAVVFASLTIGISFFIVLQIAAVLNLPLMLIPILCSRDNREESV